MLAVRRTRRMKVHHWEHDCDDVRGSASVADLRTAALLLIGADKSDLGASCRRTRWYQEWIRFTWLWCHYLQKQWKFQRVSDVLVSLTVNWRSLRTKHWSTVYLIKDTKQPINSSGRNNQQTRQCPPPDFELRAFKLMISTLFWGQSSTETVKSNKSVHETWWCHQSVTLGLTGPVNDIITVSLPLPPLCSRSLYDSSRCSNIYSHFTLRNCEVTSFNTNCDCNTQNCWWWRD